MAKKKEEGSALVEQIMDDEIKTEVPGFDADLFNDNADSSSKDKAVNNNTNELEDTSSDEEPDDTWGVEEEDDEEDNASDEGLKKPDEKSEDDDSWVGESEDAKFLELLKSETKIEATDIKDALSKIKSQLEEKELLKTQLDEALSNNSEFDPVKAKLHKYLSLDPETLIKEDLKSQGLNESEVNQYYDELESEGIVGAEAIRIKREIRIAIKRLDTDREANKNIQQQENTKRQNEWNTQVKNALSKTEQFMGTKMGKNSQETQKLLDKVYNSYVNGNIFKEITSSPENLAQVALMWSLRNQLEKKLSVKGANAERRRILVNDFGNASLSRVGELPRKPKGKDDEYGDFDAVAFVG